MKPIQYISNSCSNDYRFGFNGQEKDQEIYNNQSTTTATFWEYDGRIGRRWNLDPKPQIFISDYACFGNNPIFMVDPNGDVKDNYNIKEDGTTTVEKTEDKSDTYTYQKDNGTTVDLGTFAKNADGYLKIPNKGANFINYSKKSKSFVNPTTWAGILGAAQEYKSESGLDVQITQLNREDGGHSSHGGNGGCADIRYANSNGNINEAVLTNGNNFDKSNSQLLANLFTKYGFEKPGKYNILTENSSGSGPALSGTNFVDGKGVFNHKHHMHLQQFNSNSIREIKLNRTPIIFKIDYNDLIIQKDNLNIQINQYH